MKKVALVLVAAIMFFSGCGQKANQQLAARKSVAEVGVPRFSIDYCQDVRTWWGQHPLNPASPNYRAEIQSPRNTVTLPDGADIQAAINALPAEGGTIILQKGSYGGFEIVRRQNIHFRGEDGATITGGVRVFGCEDVRDYGGFSSCAHQRKPSCIDCLYHQPTQNIYFRNLSFNGGMTCRTCRGVMWDKCRFTGRSHTAHAVNNHLYYRDCEFLGSGGYAVYWDGVHGGGYLNCTFGPGYQRMFLQGYTNDDFTWDYNNDENWSGHEDRELAYVVFAGNHFGPVGGFAMTYAGSHLLVTGNQAEKMPDLVQATAKQSAKNYTFNSYDLVVTNNRAPEVKNLLHVLGSLKRPKDNPNLQEWYVWTEYNIGRYTVENNLIGKDAQAVFEDKREGKVDGPNFVKNNGPEVNPDAPGKK